MELKPYQRNVITDLENFLGYLDEHGNASKAYNEYWKDRVGEYALDPQTGTTTGMRPYKDNIPGAIHIAIKVPTAGGKTFIACNAMHILDKHFNQGNPKTVVWLVPWSNLLQQTVGNLSNPQHPYRQKLNSLFGNRVEVYEKKQLLQGANFNPTSVTEQLNIFVFSFSSLRINSRKQDDRKVYQENGALEAFRNTIVDENLLLPETDETALINVIRSLNPVVVVDESHNAESDLSVEMLNNLNPSLVLDLTATPKKNSNIISFVNAVALKKENMVKLPVIVYNHHKKEEVITSALHLQRRLELAAREEEKETGKYIRPIILFQAQSNIKGKKNTTFQKIKDQLVKIGIPEEQIKIKVSGTDELKGLDLMAKDCPVLYIITVNALKEGWDCPNAYILASLADKSSAVEVEQILGRVLRQPYVVKHKNPLLNMSYVLTASVKFNETLDNIVRGLQESGFSKDDYYAEEQPEEELSDNEILQQDLFGESTPTTEIKSDEEFDVASIEFDPTEEITMASVEESGGIISQITERAIIEGQAFEEKVKETELDDSADVFAAMTNTQPKKYKIAEQFQDTANQISLPQFFLKVEEDELSEPSLFEELNKEDQFLNKNSLLDGFKLLGYGTQITFDDISKEIYKVDFSERRKAVVADKIDQRSKKILVDNILAKPKETQIQEISKVVVKKLGDMTPISQQELTKYVSRIFDDLAPDQIRDIVDNDFIYVKKIKDKINSLTSEYARERFQVLIDTNQIIIKDNFSFKNTISPIPVSTLIGKSLYEREGKMNNFEQRMIMDVAALENVVFWHRNLDRGKGFHLNGFSKNHYPDFIIYTNKGTIILLETKGDFLDSPYTAAKNSLGKTWAQKCGSTYKYFMVFESKNVQDTYTARSIIEVLKGL